MRVVEQRWAWCAAAAVEWAPGAGSVASDADEHSMLHTAQLTQDQTGRGMGGGEDPSHCCSTGTIVTSTCPLQRHFKRAIPGAASSKGAMAGVHHREQSLATFALLLPSPPSLLLPLRCAARLMVPRTL